MLITVVILLGLVVFEIVNSVDNAIVNAHVLKTMSARARKWFLLWGIIFAVVVVRGVLPLLIVWLTTADVTFFQAVRATFGNDATARAAMDASAHVLLVGAGSFLVLLYLHWLFLDKKDPYFVPDKLIKPHHGIWFFAVSAILLVLLLWLLRNDPIAMLAAATGNAVFFILYGFREMAEKEEQHLEQHARSDLAKLMFLEVLDTSFSIDGVLGAFAFTTNVLLIFIGNGIGAFVVRELTIRGVDKVGRYRWLKNGAMTSIGALGLFMVLEALGVHLPEWLPTVITISLVGITFWESHRHLKRTVSSVG